MKNSLQEILERRGREKNIRYDLARIREALASYDNPERCGRTLIVGGTNGKGSTTLFLTALLKETGHSVATFLSPHLQCLSERFLLNLNPIDPGELESLARAYEGTAEKFSLTYFEYLTFLYYMWANSRRPDFLVTEVGLGGKLDATNVTNPIASVLTNVGLDHQKYLGDTLQEILADKLHITRPEGLLFTGLEDPTLIQQAIEHCDKEDTIYYLSRELKLKRKKVSWDGQEVEINGHPIWLQNPSKGHLKNAALAFLVARIVFPKIPLPTIQNAFAKVVNPGRLEVVQNKPRVVLSADHNPHGQESLFESLGDLPTGKLHILCAFSLDKPYREMYRRLNEKADSVLLTRVPDTDPPTDYLALGEYEPNPLRAVERALARCPSQDTLVITGSTYLVGAVRRLWHSNVNFIGEGSTAAFFYEKDTSLGSLPSH